MYGLSEIRLDQTTEEQLRHMVPYLTQKDWKAVGISYRVFYVQISSESDPRILGFIGSGLERSGQLADWLGYRFMSFDASVLAAFSHKR